MEVCPVFDAPDYHPDAWGALVLSLPVGSVQ